MAERTIRPPTSIFGSAYHHRGGRMHPAARRYRAAARRAARTVRRNAWRETPSALGNGLFSRMFAALGVFTYALAGFLFKTGETLRNRFSHRTARSSSFAAAQTMLRRVNTALAFLSVGIIFFFLSTYRIGVEVVMDGYSLGYVNRQSIVTQSLENVSRAVAGVLGRPYNLPNTIEYHLTVVHKNKLFDQSAVEDHLLTNTPEIARLYILSIEGNPVAAAGTKDEIDTALARILEKYQDKTTENLRFRQSISIEPQLTAAADQVDVDTLFYLLTQPNTKERTYSLGKKDSAASVAKAFGIPMDTLRDLNGGKDLDRLKSGDALVVERSWPLLSVVYDIKSSYVSPVPYATEIKDDDEMWLDTTEVAQKGVAGKSRVYTVRPVVDGYAGLETIERTEVVKSPRKEVILHGTRTRGPTGTFIRPISGVRTSPFGSRSGEFHTGQDWGAPVGTPVYAADGGTVVLAERVSSGYANFILIDHGNGYVTGYAHLSSFLVHAGQEVGQGEKIALSGNTGRSTGPHLHFEVRVDGTQVNPMNYIGERYSNR